MPTLDRTVVTLATATPGGGFPVIGQAFAEAIHAADPSLEIQQGNTKGPGRSSASARSTRSSSR